MKLNKFTVKHKNPIIAIYENCGVSLFDIAIEFDSNFSISADKAEFETIFGAVNIDTKNNMLCVANAGAYIVRAKHSGKEKDIAIISVPKTAKGRYEATLFEYDFDNKTFDEISEYFVLQTRHDALSTISRPVIPENSATSNGTAGFVPFCAASISDNGQIKYNKINTTKSVANVGFMSLKPNFAPSLFCDYTVYLDGTLLATAPYNDGTHIGSSHSAAGIAGRITTGCDGSINCFCDYQATLCTVTKNPAFKTADKFAHKRFYLTDRLFFGWDFDDENKGIFGADSKDIKIGDDYSLMASFSNKTILSGIKSGLLNNHSDFSVTEINENSYHENNPLNFKLENEKDRYNAADFGLCEENCGTVGFIYNGAETALHRFKVTHTINLDEMPKSVEHSENIKFTQNNFFKKTNGTFQKQLNVFGQKYGTKSPNENSLKITVLTDQHYDYYDTRENKNGYAERRKNFLSALDRSDTEFVLMLGDNARWALDYTPKNIIDANLHLKALYGFLNQLSRKDVFAIRGNHDYCTNDYPDRFVLKTETATFICFRSEYCEFTRSADMNYIPSAGIVTADTLAWLESECKKAVTENPEVLLIFANHFSCQNNPEKFSAAMKDDGDYNLAEKNLETLGRNDLLDIITKYGVKLYLNGHEHSDKMDYEEITYQHGYKTGCINYSVGIAPTEIKIKIEYSSGKKKTSVAFRQFSYADTAEDFDNLEEIPAKHLKFYLIESKTEDVLKLSSDFSKAKQNLKNIFSGRYNGLYKYCFEYIGKKSANGIDYFGFKVSYLKYFILTNGVPTTIYADPDRDKKSDDLKIYIDDIFISANGEILRI